MKRLKGFTLTELMVALAVIGILTAVVTPAVIRIRPNKIKMMTKKAYYTVENIVSNMINNTNQYQDYSDIDEKVMLGFDDVETEAMVKGVAVSGNTKFATIFASKLNTKEDCTSASNIMTCNTTDGMTWYLPETDFGGEDGTSGTNSTCSNKYCYTTMYVDVNGSSTEPNCRQNGKDYAGTNCTGSADDFDTFAIDIYEDGTMRINSTDSEAAKYIQIDTKVSGN